MEARSYPSTLTADEPRAARIAAQVALVILAEAAVMGGTMFYGAGTVDWEWAWLLFAVAAASLVPAILALSIHSPALLVARMKLSPRGQPLADRIFVPAHSGLMLSWAWFVGKDAGAIHWWTIPVDLRGLAMLLIPVATWAGYRTMRDNPYLATCICLQDDQSHRVVDTGAYAVVRHPFYAVTIAYQVCASLVLGSGLGLMLTGVIGLVLGLRIGVEEQFLERELPGYAAYKQTTRWRLLPGLW